MPLKSIFIIFFLFALIGPSSSLWCWECRNKDDCKHPERTEPCPEEFQDSISHGNAKFPAACGYKSTKEDGIIQMGCSKDHGHPDKDCKDLEDGVKLCTCKTDYCSFSASDLEEEGALSSVSSCRCRPPKFMEAIYAAVIFLSWHYFIVNL